MKSFEKMFFLAGLPRTGSTLLTAILSQNPNILSEGSSGLVEIMWQNYIVLKDNEYVVEALKNTNKTFITHHILNSLPRLYYKDFKHKYIIDKSRAWTNLANIQIIKEYIEEKPKIIVMLRPITEILESFYYIYQKNNKLNRFENDLFNLENPLMHPYQSLLDSLPMGKESFLLLTYKELVNQPEKTINKIYDFLEIPHYNHNFNNIINIFPEGDYGLSGLHEVRNKIGFRDKKIILPEHIKEKGLEMQIKLENKLKEVGIENVF